MVCMWLTGGRDWPSKQGPDDVAAFIPQLHRKVDHKHTYIHTGRSTGRHDMFVCTNIKPCMAPSFAVVRLCCSAVHFYKQLPVILSRVHVFVLLDTCIGGFRAIVVHQHSSTAHTDGCSQPAAHIHTTRHPGLTLNTTTTFFDHVCTQRPFEAIDC